MKKLFACCLLLTSCVALKDLFFEPKYEYCGNTKVFNVYRKDFSFLTCGQALATTNAAYNLLLQKGPLKEQWDVVYMWGAIDVSDPYARTTPESHLIQVQEKEARNILHELGHAYMFENQLGDQSQHAEMCADQAWQKLEREFDVRPYCTRARQLNFKEYLQQLSY